MSLYCGTFDVATFGQVEYRQMGFASLAIFNNWMRDTLIPKAMDMVDNYVGHNFHLNWGTIRLDGPGKAALHLTRIGVIDDTNDGVANFIPPRLLPVPMISITSVSVDSVAKTVTDFQVYDEIITYENNIFAAGRQNVEIMGTWGYGTYSLAGVITEVAPHDIQYVTAQICSNALTEIIRRKMIPDLITPVLTGGGDVGILFSSPKVLTKNEKDILNRYRFREYAVG